VLHEISLLRLRSLLAHAHRDAAAYASFRDRYRKMVKSLGFEGHVSCSETMP
jgi:adenylate cyclase